MNSLHSNFQKKYEKSNLSGLLSQYSGLLLRTDLLAQPYPRAVPTCPPKTLSDGTVLQGLPYSLEPDDPDMRFVSGHLGDSNVLSPAAQAVISRIVAPSVSWRPPLRLISLVTLSGVGKTKCLFDILRRHWGLFFDMNGSEDHFNDAAVQVIKSKIQKRLTTTQSVSDMEAYCGEQASLLVASRLIMLLVLRAIGSVTNPEQWLLTCLGENEKEFPVIDIMEHLESSGQMNRSLLPMLLSAVQCMPAAAGDGDGADGGSEAKGEPVVICVDEIQSWLTLGLEIFKTSLSPKQLKCLSNQVSFDE